MEQRSADKITLDGDTWRIVARGTNEDGKTYCHLASTTRFINQKNGRRPIMAGVWVPNEVLP